MDRDTRFSRVIRGFSRRFFSRSAGGLRRIGIGGVSRGRSYGGLLFGEAHPSFQEFNCRIDGRLDGNLKIGLFRDDLDSFFRKIVLKAFESLGVSPVGVRILANPFEKLV